MSLESHKSGSSMGRTPIKALKRDVKGLLSLPQEDSPSQSEVLWTTYDSPIKNNRAIGGRSKSLKSSNQLTPKNQLTRKKYYSSPILVARVNENGKQEDMTEAKIAENKRILEEFQRQFNNDSYVPRNLLDNLSEGHEDSIIMPETEIDSCNNKIGDDSDFIDNEDLDMLEELEQQARKMLDEKLENDAKVANTKFSNFPLKTDSKVQKPTEYVDKAINKVPEKKTTHQNPYIDSDDDDLILSIPVEKLTDQNSSSNVQSRTNQPSGYSCSSHSSVIPIRKEFIKTSIENVQININSCAASNSVNDEPLAKKKCTAEEIAEKRRQAMLRREAFMRSLKATQNVKGK